MKTVCQLLLMFQWTKGNKQETALQVSVWAHHQHTQLFCNFAKSIVSFSSIHISNSTVHPEHAGVVSSTAYSRLCPTYKLTFLLLLPLASMKTVCQLILMFPAVLLCFTRSYLSQCWLYDARLSFWLPVKLNINTFVKTNATSLKIKRYLGRGLVMY